MTFLLSAASASVRASSLLFCEALPPTNTLQPRGGHPFRSAAHGVAVNGDEYGLLSGFGVCPVCPVHTLCQWHVCFFGYDADGIDARLLQLSCYPDSYFAGVGVFPQPSVGERLPGVSAPWPLSINTFITSLFICLYNSLFFLSFAGLKILMQGNGVFV